MSIWKIQGRLMTTGPVLHDGIDNGSEPAAIYQYVRFEEEGRSGAGAYLQNVFVSSYLDSLLDAGVAGTFYVVELAMPKLFGSRPFYFIYAVEIGGTLYEAIPQTKRILNGCKGAVGKLAWYGLILLIAWGFGLLLWVQAGRLFAMQLPEAAMANSLQPGHHGKRR